MMAPRVLHVLAPGQAGGLESVVQALVPGLQRRDVPVAVTAVLGAQDTEPPIVRALQGAGVEVFVQRAAGRDYLAQWRSHRQRAEQWRADVVHTHGYLVDVLAGHAVRGRSARVSTAHGFTGGDWKNDLYEWLQVRGYRKFDRVIAVSRTVQERLRRSGVPHATIELLPNAWGNTGTAVSRAEARTRLGIAEGTPVLGWVGRLSREKGADIFLETLARLTHLPLRASIVGDGPERAALTAQAERLGIADRITWHGLVPAAGTLMSAFDLFVLSSRTEGTPISLLEAMAARVPVVVTAVGGVPDVVSATEGWITAPEPPALASALEHALGNREELSRRAVAAEARLARQFALEPWIDRHVQLYAELTRRKAGS